MLLRSQKVVCAVVAGLAGLAMLVLAAGTPRPVPAVRVAAMASQFDGATAVEYTRAVAEGFPDRVTGSDASRRAGEYLRAEFEKLGYRVESPTFSMWLAGQRVQGENLIAHLPGGVPETIAVIAHYDGQTTSHQAAEDNASGVGVMLELARVARLRPHRRGLIFAATDAEEWGMIGARHLIPFLKSQGTVAVLSIDYLNAGSAPALEINPSGQFGGYTPLWLRELVVTAGKVQGAQVVQPSGLWEWIERALQVSFQDQGPLVRAGIPALNIATLTKELAASRARYHTPQDVFRDFDPASFKLLGATLDQALVTLDDFTPPAGNGMGAFRLASDRYLTGDVVWLLQALAFAPLVLMGVYAAQNLLARKHPPRALLLLTPAGWSGPLWLAAVALYVLTAANILKRYDLYPATPKDPFLYTLPLAVILTLSLVLVLGFVILRRLYSRLEFPPESFADRKRALFLWVAAVALTGFLVNPYATGLFLGVFSYAAAVLLPPRGILPRALNAVLLLAALVPFSALLYFFGKEIFLGWRILWYLVLQTAYGVWSPLAVALFLLAGALWAQLFWHSVVHASSSSGPPGAGS